LSPRPKPAHRIRHRVQAHSKTSDQEYSVNLTERLLHLSAAVGGRCAGGSWRPARSLRRCLQSRVLRNWKTHSPTERFGVGAVREKDGFQRKHLTCAV